MSLFANFLVFGFYPYNTKELPAIYTQSFPSPDHAARAFAKHKALKRQDSKLSVHSGYSDTGDKFTTRNKITGEVKLYRLQNPSDSPQGYITLESPDMDPITRQKELQRARLENFQIESAAARGEFPIVPTADPAEHSVMQNWRLAQLFQPEIDTAENIPSSNTSHTKDSGSFFANDQFEIKSPSGKGKPSRLSKVKWFDSEFLRSFRHL